MRDRFMCLIHMNSQNKFRQLAQLTNAKMTFKHNKKIKFSRKKNSDLFIRYKYALSFKKYSTILFFL